MDPLSSLLPFDGIVTYHGTLFTQSQATLYLRHLLASIPWQHDHLVIMGRPVTTQRKTAWYGDKPYAYTYSHATKVALPWTQELSQIKAQVEQASGECYNACLLNLYHSGQEGMGWHSDHEDTIVAGSAIASVSLGAERKLCFRHKRSQEKVSLSLAHGSLLVMKGQTQAHWQHSLPKAMRVQQPRVNLTFRKMID